MKAAIVVLSDPKNGGDEALGRVFNALAAAYDFKERGHAVQILFQGAGTRWAGQLVRADHPAHALYMAVEDKVAGASSGCSDVFGARAEVEESGLRLISDTAIPGTSGLPSLAGLASEGYTILTF